MHLYFLETSAVSDSDKIDAAEAKRMITVTQLTRLTEEKLPERGNMISQAFWYEEKDIDKMELLQGDHVRLKTKGDGPFIGNLVILSLYERWIMFTCLFDHHGLI